MKMLKCTSILLIFLFVAGITGLSYAKDDLGSVIAIKNKAVIKNDRRTTDAKVNDGILLTDTVTTQEASKIKMLFKDESVLTLGEKSTVAIKDFVYDKGKRGQSAFNLIDGKMRSVVGKTNFTVHSPTAVAAARGTIILFETGITPDGKKFTRIICLEGEVDITSSDPRITGMVKLTAGMMITVIEGEPLPGAVAASEADITRLRLATDISEHEIRMEGPIGLQVGPEGIKLEPPFNQLTPPPPPPPTTPTPPPPPPPTTPPTTPPPPPPPPTTPPTWTPPYSPPPLLAPPAEATPPTGPPPCTECYIINTSINDGK